MSPRRQRGAALTALACVVAMAASSLGVLAFYQARTEVPELDAARWFGTRAMWSAIDDADGQPVAAVSQTGAGGLDPVDLFPLSTAYQIRGEVAAHPDSQMWTAITTARFANGNHLNIPEVLLASDEGVTQLVGFVNVILPVSFDPPMTVLPADVEEGATWSQEGTADYGSLTFYDYELDAEVVDVARDGCATVRTEAAYVASADGRDWGGTDYTDTLESTYCPGRWLTAYTTADGTVSRAVTAATARERLSEIAPPVVTEVEDSQEAEALIYDRPYSSTASADALVLPDSRVVVDADRATYTVTGAVWNDALIVPQWRLVGEGPTVAAPVRAGGVVVVADTHGVVTALEGTSGFVLWQDRGGRLPMALSADDESGLVAVLDRGGSVRLLDLENGREIASVPAGASPLGVTLMRDGDDPVLVVADTSSIRGYDDDGDSLFTVDEAPSTAPTTSGGRAFVGTEDGRLLAVDADGEVEETYLGDLVVRDLAGGTGRVAVLGDDERFRLVDADDLAVTHVTRDDGRAITVGADGDVETFTTTARDGTITTYAADGTRLRTLQAPLESDPPEGFESLPGGQATQWAAAVSWGGSTWAPAVTGLVRWGPR